MTEKPPTLRYTLDTIKTTVAEQKPEIAAALAADVYVRKAMGLDPRGIEIDMLRALCDEQGSTEGMVKNPLETVRARGVAIESAMFGDVLDLLNEKTLVEDLGDYVKVLPAGFVAVAFDPSSES